MSKKRSFVLHTVNGDEVVVTLGGFDYCCGSKERTVVCLMGEEFSVIETPAIVSNLLDELED